ncbi:efflux RND transporter periplasmic adaptor subunit [Pectobacterium brasiliense]|uniref:efflux RND transporter periplasmic adaptor subunit n=1 Tax=Pectobacterium brasiliense TaxID=180957 RepID=UPI0019694DA4|nr:HlyD family efflux transporter periplasmic adaptor subunit [Pectobacterium brasiliense]MBN3121932.1 HlyD family efflux transporter periplasmic adaptor subunit [Pectobacterium brasiliense]QSD22107.1 HlyD family efflux transporter periplasmic adaptor subunit [Pectobacterium brasiliense]
MIERNTTVAQTKQGTRLALLAELLQLQSRARARETLDELAFFIVNETHNVVKYRQALLWDCDKRRLQAASGLASLDHNAPFCTEFSRLCRQWQEEGHQTQALQCCELPADDQILWQEHLPEFLLWLPLRLPQGDTPLVLVLARDSAWLPAEIVLLEKLADAYAHAWSSLCKVRRRPSKTPPARRRLIVAAIVALVLILLIPVRQSVLAPAEIVAHRPVMVRAPVAGVVDDILVRPNQTVSANQPLVRLDVRELENRLESARQAFATADAQYRQAQQQALFDANSKASLAVLQSRREQAQSEMDFLQRQQERMQLASPRDGVAIFDDSNDWIGRSVAVGERIMMIADPHDVELEIQLPAADAIALENGADVRLFLNVAPNSAQDARLEQIGYRAAPTPDNVMAYRLRARFTQDDPQLRVGLKGTAKLYGKRTVLFVYLLRKPLASLRVWLGV